ncbi:hypothetical protein L596_019136 [Steinernema carpocapsae]|uniref:Uncharacterized protein n=1 Tax=Steinernema carpocapsae TaxID=34508 RepID=A0A4U5N7V9_STECR|nr:hypothetical protein L596_019136 [Steinernema carpocapsae]
MRTILLPFTEAILVRKTLKITRETLKKGADKASKTVTKVHAKNASWRSEHAPKKRNSLPTFTTKYKNQKKTKAFPRIEPLTSRLPVQTATDCAKRTFSLNV